jgi:hypothetical protein
MEIGVAGVGVEELVEIGEHRHDGESPLVTRSTLERRGRFSLCITLYPSTNCEKLSDFCSRVLTRFDIRGINQRLETIFNTDFNALANRLNNMGLSHSYQMMLKDINYLIQQGFLRSNEKRETLKTQIQFVLSRLIICRRMASQLLKYLGWRAQT